MESRDAKHGVGWDRTESEAESSAGLGPKLSACGWMQICGFGFRAHFSKNGPAVFDFAVRPHATTTTRNTTPPRPPSQPQSMHTLIIPLAHPYQLPQGTVKPTVARSRLDWRFMLVGTGALSCTRSLETWVPSLPPPGRLPGTSRSGRFARSRRCPPVRYTVARADCRNGDCRADPSCHRRVPQAVHRHALACVGCV